MTPEQSGRWLLERMQRHLGIRDYSTQSLLADRSPERNGARCHYNAAFLADIVLEAGWQPLARYPAEAPLIGDSFVCGPRGA